MKIAHISDLHFDRQYKMNNIKKVDTFLNHISSLEIDHLVITGDISHNVNKFDYYILKDLLKKYNLLQSEKTSLVIGNHDIFGGVITAEDVIDFPNRCKEINYEEKILEFFEIFSELFDSAIFVGENNSFPYVKNFNNFVFAGLNSNARYSLIKNLFASNGKVYKEQVADLEILLNKEEVKQKEKIVLIHHHFSKFHRDLLNKKNPMWDKVEKSTMKLRGKKKLLDLFKRNNVRLVLHGHVHQMSDYKREGIMFCNAGSSIDNYDNEKIQFNLINIDETNISRELCEVEHHYEEQKIEVDSLLV